MKKRIITMAIIALMMVGVTNIISTASVARADDGVWDSCSKGMVDCEYPGACGSYVDTNNDNICDRSQLPPQQEIIPEDLDTVESSIIYNPFNNIPDDNGLEDDIPGSVAYKSEDAGEGRHINIYNLLPILIVSTILYLLTWILSKRKIVSQKLHRRVWNIVLLISTLVSALLGLFLILNLEFKAGITLPFNMLFWHVEAGIAMSAVAIFHILWHWKYFTRIFQAAA
jgi:hypothetical protein